MTKIYLSRAVKSNVQPYSASLSVGSPSCGDILTKRDVTVDVYRGSESNDISKLVAMLNKTDLFGTLHTEQSRPLGDGDSLRVIYAERINGSCSNSCPKCGSCSNARKNISSLVYHVLPVDGELTFNLGSKVNWSPLSPTGISVEGLGSQGMSTHYERKDPRSHVTVHAYFRDFHADVVSALGKRDLTVDLGELARKK